MSGRHVLAFLALAGFAFAVQAQEAPQPAPKGPAMQERCAANPKAWLAAAHPIGTALSTSEGQGLFDGLDEAGALRLRLADGTTRVIHAGDVFLI